MTDLEIDKKLAVAIGWPIVYASSDGVCWVSNGPYQTAKSMKFSHKDWNVIGPIAARYDCSPLRLRGGAWEAISRGKYKLGFVKSDTPQKAIALAVIGAKKWVGY